MRILVMTDSPFVPSGLGKVGKNIALGLKRHNHDVAYLAWFHHPDIPQERLDGIQVWFTNDSLYGAEILDRIVNRFQPDVLLTVGDLWNLSYIYNGEACKTRRWFQWCSYIAVDGEPLNGGLPPGLVPIVNDIDIPVAYTNYAKKSISKSSNDDETRSRLDVIYHGVDTNLFKPTSHERRMSIRRSYGIRDDQFVFLTVSRNQSRKNIPELFRAWKIFADRPQNKNRAMFWPHMTFTDTAGWNIDHLFDVIGLKQSEEIMFYQSIAKSPHAMLLMPEEELATLYQIADCFILISGEGFGLPTFEAMATGLPCILLDYAASSELGADGRAELVPCPVESTATWTGMYLTQRPTPNPELIADAMQKIIDNRDYRERMAKKGFEFARSFPWQKIQDQWAHKMLKIEVPFAAPMQLQEIS